MSEDVNNKGFLSWYFKSNLLMRIMLGLLIGAVIGIALGASGNTELTNSFVSNTKFFGDLFIRLLKMIVVPVVLFSLITGAASIAPANLGKVGLKALCFYLFTSAFAVVIGLTLASLFRPGEGFDIIGTGADLTVRATPSMLDAFLAIVPTNPIDSLAKGDILPIIFFAILFGIGISLLKDSDDKNVVRSAEVLFDSCTAAANVMYKIVAGIMQYAPIGVLVLIAHVFAVQGPSDIGSLFLVTFTSYLGMFLQAVVVYAIMLKYYKLSPVRFFKEGSQPIITAFVTRSSGGTLPITLSTCENKFGVPRSISSFSLPLGATVNMDGTAIYLGVCSMFIGFATSNPLTFDQQIIVITTATLASIGTAGVPGAGAIMLIMVMESIGLPIVPGTSVAAAYAVVLGIDALLDMARTGLNVAGDMVATIVISSSEDALDRTKWTS